MSNEILQRRMAEIGPLLDLAEVIEYAQDGFWVLVFDDGLPLEVEADDTGRRVLFSMEVAPLPPERADALCRTLLRAGLLWRQSGGIHYALDRDTVVQMLELPLEQLDLPTLSTVLRNLHAGALHWRTVLSTEQGDPTEIRPIAFTGGALRV